MGAPTKLCIAYSTMRAAFTIATIASLALFARVSADTCANSCFSENCDFHVKNWGISCATAESEYGCSCAGCACLDTEEAWMKSERTYGRRTGTGTGSSTSAPTSAPVSAVGAIKLSMTISLDITSAQFTTDVQSAFKTSVANSLGNSEITADHVTITDFSRRALSIAFEVETPYTDMSTQSSNIDALSSTLTSQMTSTASGGFITLFNTNAAAVVSGWTSVAAPSITVAAATITQAPTAAPTAATVVDSAPVGDGSCDRGASLKKLCGDNKNAALWPTSIPVSPRFVDVVPSLVDSGRVGFPHVSRRGRNAGAVYRRASAAK